MIDPQMALAAAIAHSRAQQVQPPMPAMHPTMIHAIASHLAQTLANGRLPLGQQQVLQPSYNPTPTPHILQPGNFDPSNPNDADNGFFGHWVAMLQNGPQRVYPM